MGIMDKLMFWKHDDSGLGDLGKAPDLGMDPGLGKGFGAGPSPGNDNLGFGNNDIGLPGSHHDNGSGAGPAPSFGQNAPFGQQPPSGQPPSFSAQNQIAPPGFQSAPPPVMPQQTNHEEFSLVSKDIELLSYKLDTLKAAIDMVNQRLANIERMATNETQKKRQW